MADNKEVWQLCGIIQLRQSEIPANSILMIKMGDRSRKRCMFQA